VWTFSQTTRERHGRYNEKDSNDDDGHYEDVIESFEHLQFITLLASTKVGDGSWMILCKCRMSWQVNKEKPFSECMIHKRNPLNVNPSGITKSRSTSADVDSSFNSTIPIAYSTDIDFHQYTNPDNNQSKHTSKNEVTASKNLAPEHCPPEGFTYNTKAQRNN